MPVTAYDQIEHASLTDVGVQRPHNQDAHAVLLAADAEQWQRRGHVFLVADGMGAHAVGELASELAAGVIPHAFHKYAGEGPEPALRKAFLEANSSIHTRGQQNPEFQGMGTTATALCIRGDGAWVGHVGDSRVYRVRDAQIEQLSFDHSLAWELARRKGIRPEGLEGVPKNVIVRSLGPEPLVQVDVEGPYPVREGDTFVLCSDGLSGPVPDAKIGMIASALPPAEACQLLVDLANLEGGPDNITALVVHVGPARERAAAAPGTRHPGVPWFLPALLVGGLAAGILLNLVATPPMRGSEAVRWALFALAAVSLTLGLVGLVLHYRPAAGETVYAAAPRRRPYRRVACRIDRAAADRMARDEASLAEQLRAKEEAVDWAARDQCRRQAEQLQQRGDWVGAFRESCRAMLVLTAALPRLRDKGEEFQPVWDRPNPGAHRNNHRPPAAGEGVRPPNGTPPAPGARPG